MVSILGVQFTDMTEEQVVAQCKCFMQSERSHVLITAGPEFVMGLQREPSLYRLTDAADLVTPDGIGIVLAARWRGQPLRERVTGVELTERLIAFAHTAGLRVFLLGAAESSLRIALERLRMRYPGLYIIGRNGYFTKEMTPSVIAEICEFRPHLLLVGLGQPRQDLFIADHRNVLCVPLAIGVGGTIDIIAGTVKRAPVWLRKAKLEWLFRLLQEPSRFRRQLVLPVFAWRAWREARRDSTR